MTAIMAGRPTPPVAAARCGSIAGLTMDQLDIFADSRDRVLINAVADALIAGDPAGARCAAQALQCEFPADRHLLLAALLTDWLTAELHAASTPWPCDAAAAALAARRQFEQQIVPAAQQMLGSADAARWAAARWRALAQRAAALPYTKAHADTHAAALWLQAGEWAKALRAAEATESWRRRPGPLAWVVQARWHLAGADAVWPLLAELAWMAPARVPPLLALLPDAGMRKLARRFGEQAMAELETAAAGRHATCQAPPGTTPQATQPTPAQTEGWAWWPAWVLIEQPLLTEPLSGAQPSGDGAAPERAFALVRALLHLERQGRHHDRVAQRRQLLDLSPTLFRCYMATR